MSKAFTKIQEIEEKAEQIIKDARKNALHLTSEAKANGEKLISNLLNRAEHEAEKISAEARKAAEHEAKNIQAQTEKEINSLKSRAGTKIIEAKKAIS